MSRKHLKRYRDAIHGPIQKRTYKPQDSIEQNTNSNYVRGQTQPDHSLYNVLRAISGREQPFHYPGYNYCGPGTDWSHLEHPPEPINALDKACKQHDEDPEFKMWRWNQADARLYRFCNQNLNNPIFGRAAYIIKNVFALKRKLQFADHSTSKRYKHMIKRSYTQLSQLSDKLHGTDMRYRRRNYRKVRGKTKTYTKRQPSNSGRYGKKRRRKIYRGKRKFSRKSHSLSTRSSKRLNQKIASVMNPPITYERQDGGSIQHNSTDGLWTKMLHDPLMIGKTNQTVWVNYCPWANQNICTMINDLGIMKPTGFTATGLATTSLTTTGYGNKFWVLNTFVKYRLTNYGSLKTYVKVHYFRSKGVNNYTPIQFIDTAGYETNSDLYPNQTTATGGGDYTYGTKSANNDYAIINKLTDIREIKPIKAYWKHVGSKFFTIMPNETKVITFKKPCFLWDPAIYNTYQWKDKDPYMLFEYSLDLTAEAADTNQRSVADYASTRIVYETYFKVKLAKKTDKQEKHYQVIYTRPRSADSDSNWGVTAGVIGVPVQTGGADQKADT